MSGDRLLDDELSDLQEVLDDLSDCDDLTDWEAGFVEDMIERLEKYENRTLVSDRQQEQIDRMKAKYL